MILLSLTFAAGCSSDPRVEANDAVERANEDISAHDELFDEARGSYSESRQAVRDGSGDGNDSEGSGETRESTGSESPAARGASEARNKLQDARGRLQEGREEISGIQELEVSDSLMRYSRTLEGAISAQMRAEEREISFYEILAEDPSLEDNRDRATELLDEARQAYTEAENGYQEAAEIAGSSPEITAPGSGGSTGS
ncbi:hypothetical protein [Rubrobacter aplysinae]|uniref:hypothetical protein n=1 Tax=Rubrobacter aplysinae TaxID=909625 RepID=UPI00064C4458|nr:hypothetical protein [Rubrobacter aplysinae]